jgi:tetratricopeptide (TPR) repeat protein
LFPIEGVWLAVAVGSAWALIEEFPAPTQHGRRRRATAHLLSCVALLGLHANTDVLRDYWKYRGGDTRRRGETRQAVAAYEQVVAIDPDYASGHARLSDLYRRTGELDAALREAREAERLKPTESAYPARAARLQQQLGETAAARQSAQRALELGSTDADIEKLAR